jgi:hypothetical protein
MRMDAHLEIGRLVSVIRRLTHVERTDIFIQVLSLMAFRVFGCIIPGGMCPGLCA